MQPIPNDILEQFDAALKEKAVSVSLRDDYRKWLRYYLDFRVKYPPPDSKSEQVRLFIEKMRSKGKAGKDLHHAAHALSLFFSLQSRNKRAAVHADRVMELLSSPPARKPIKTHPPLNLPSFDYTQDRLERGEEKISLPVVTAAPVNRGGEEV